MTKGHPERSEGSNFYKRKTMWLPKDERKLLAFYYAKAQKPNVTLEFPDNIEPMKILGYKDCNEEKSNVESNPFFLRVCDANENLKRQGLIHFTFKHERKHPKFSLTFEGDELGKKYSCIPGKIELCCREYIWLWVVLGVIIGLITLIVTIFNS